MAPRRAADGPRRLRITVSTAYLVAAAASPLAATPAAAQCRAADPMGAAMVRKWRGIMAATDSSVRAALRRNSIAQVDSSTVVMVTDRATCAKAMGAYNSVRGDDAQPPSGAVYVIKVGTMYVVRDPVQRSPGSGWYGDVILDANFVVKSQLLGS